MSQVDGWIDGYDLYGNVYDFYGNGNSYEFHGKHRSVQYIGSHRPVKHRLIDDAIAKEGSIDSRQHGFRNYLGSN